jgi:hypothetical protein
VGFLKKLFGNEPEPRVLIPPKPPRIVLKIPKVEVVVPCEEKQEFGYEFVDETGLLPTEDCLSIDEVRYVNYKGGVKSSIQSIRSHVKDCVFCQERLANNPINLARYGRKS